MSHVISHQDKVIKEITEKKGTVYVNTKGSEIFGGVYEIYDSHDSIPGREEVSVGSMRNLHSVVDILAGKFFIYLPTS